MSDDEPPGPISLDEARRKRRRRAQLPGDGSHPEERPISWFDCPVSAVGVIGDMLVFVDCEGQRRNLSAQAFSSWQTMAGLFGGHTEWILRECPPARVGAHAAPFNAPRLAMGLIGRAFEAGVIASNITERQVGVWSTPKGLLVHAGDALRIGAGDWQRPGVVLGDAFYVRDSPTIRPSDAPAPAAQGRALVEWLRKWNWEQPDAAELVAGWLFVASLGHAASWRPHLWLAAAGGAGKSTLLGVLARVMPAAKYLNRATEPGLRRLIAGHAVPVMCDEGDESEVAPNRLQAIIEMARLLSGGTGLRAVQAGDGSTGVTTFEAVGCVLWASIHRPSMSAQDRSRITFLDLAPAQGLLDLPALETWADAAAPGLWARIVAGLDNFRATFALLTSKLRDPERGMGARMADQAGSLLAGAWALQHDAPPNDMDAEALITRFEWLWDDEPSDVAANDGEACLAHLLGAAARQSGPRTPVGDLVGRARFEEPNSSADMALRAHGLRWLPDKGAEAKGVEARGGLAVAQRHPALNELFQGTAWRGGRWASALGRLPDAITGRKAPVVRLSAGLKPRCVLLPRTLFDEDAAG